MWRQVCVRLRSLWRWRRRESELDEEIRFHLAEEIEERIAAGMSAEQARAAARRDFGNVTLIRELTRETWGWGPVERLLQDARSAIRGLRRNLGYACAVVLILALGIGLNAAMFGLLSRLFLQAPPQSRTRTGFTGYGCGSGASASSVSLPAQSSRSTGWTGRSSARSAPTPTASLPSADTRLLDSG